MSEIDEVTAEKIEKALPKDDSQCIQTLLKLLCAYRLKELERQMGTEIQSLRKRQQRIRWLNRVLRAVNQATDEKRGTLEIKKDSEVHQLLREGEDFLDEAEEMIAEAESLEAEIEMLETDGDADPAQIASMKKKAKALRDDAGEIKDTIQAANVLHNKTFYGKEERDRLVENIRMAHEDLTALNNQQMQAVNRVNSERHETLLMAKMLAKIVNDDIMNKARAMAR